MKNKNVKRIKDNISYDEYKYLMTYIENHPTMRETRKNRLLKIFSILFFCGLRVNEVTQINEDTIKELLSNGKSKIIAHKQSKEKYLYISSKGKEEIKKYWNSEKGYNIQSERTQKTLHEKSIINDTNKILKEVFVNKNIKSHSFRQSYITTLAEHGTSIGIIQSLVSHKSPQTTLRYVKPSEASKIKALESVF